MHSALPACMYCCSPYPVVITVCCSDQHCWQRSASCMVCYTTDCAVLQFPGASDLHKYGAMAVQDVIARAGRFWGLYKRAGHRVMINPSGDLIVRPTFIEAAAQLMRPWSESFLALPCTALPCTASSATVHACLSFGYSTAFGHSACCLYAYRSLLNFCIKVLCTLSDCMSHELIFCKLFPNILALDVSCAMYSHGVSVCRAHLLPGDCAATSSESICFLSLCLCRRHSGRQCSRPLVSKLSQVFGSHHPGSVQLKRFRGRWQGMHLLTASLLMRLRMCGIHTQIRPPPLP